MYLGTVGVGIEEGPWMATHKSAIKENRQSEARRQRNRGNRSRLRTEIKKFRAAITAGDSEKAQGLLGPTLSLIDRSARHGAINDNVASRTKSRLSKALNKVTASA